MFYAGVDIGSTTSKCVVVDDSGEIFATSLFTGGAGTEAPRKAMAEALSNAGAEEGQARWCATGYGRHLVEGADFEKSELSCHAKGASRLFPGARTIIDIGGQDAKVLRLDEHGNLENFAMNDKCAAGTGRFLDVMAGIFNCGADGLSALDDQSDHTVSISSTCTVFAESEVISKLASGEQIPNVVAGVHESVVDRTAGLVRRLGVVPPVAMTGGVARNDALRRRLAAKLGTEVQTSSLAQYNGAYGAALFALETS